ncbi:MAG: hypothetical protein R3F07_03790 [Opitutaceae bacterium]
MLPRIAFLLFGLIASSTTIRAASPTVEFTRIRQEFRTEDSFKRISEYFTGVENSGNRLVLRTRADDRDGLYFAFRIRTTVGQPLPAGTLVVFYFPPGGFEPVERRFPLETQSRKSMEVLVGLTGADWSDPDVLPAAWKLEYLDANGQSLGSELSFLWELPDEDSGPSE